MPKQNPACRLCRILAAAPGQRLEVVIKLYEAASLVPCKCVAASHRAMIKHPHTKKGCAGY